MEEKLTLKYPVVVEGKYDKARVCAVVQTPVIALDGFGIFKNNEKKMLLKRLCAENGLIILTDSDRAGSFIRARLKDFLKGEMYNVYIPSVKGRERRKTHDSADGLLGVEGMSSSVLYELLLPFCGNGVLAGAGISKAEFFECGLSGAADSSARRKEVAAYLGLPQSLTSKALFEAINSFVPRDELKKALEKIDKCL